MRITLAFAILAAAAAQAVTVTARVPATGDAAADHDAALGAARRLAVEEAVGVLVDSRVKLENQLMIQDKVLTRAAGLVKNETVEKEGAVEADLYELTLTCDVEGVPLQDLLDGVKRSVVVRINPATGEMDNRNARSVASTVRSVLAARGYKVLDEDFLKGSALGDKDPATIGTGELKTESRRWLAQVLIYGDVAVADTGEMTADTSYVGDVSFEGIHTARATGTLKAVATSDGRVLAERAAGPREFTGFGLSYGDAAADAAKRMAEACAACIAEALTPKED